MPTRPPDVIGQRTPTQPVPLTRVTPEPAAINWCALPIVNSTATPVVTSAGWGHGAAPEVKLAMDKVISTAPEGLRAGLGRVARQESPRVVFAGLREVQCQCGSRKPLRACHWSTIDKVARLRRQIMECERVVLRSWPTGCCNTMRICPVRTQMHKPTLR